MAALLNTIWDDPNWTSFQKMITKLAIKSKFKKIQTLGGNMSDTILSESVITL